MLAEPRAVRQPTYDSCVAACVATILHWPVEATPHVDHSLPAGEWWDPYVDAVREQLDVELVPLEPDPPPAGLWMAFLPSLNIPGKPHAIVMRGRDVAWDPSNDGRYEVVDLAIVQHAIVFVPLDPAGVLDGDR